MTTTQDTHSDPAQTVGQIEAVYQHLIQANPELATAASRIMAHQTAALMLEDMRSFLQGSEQLLLIALAKAAQLATAEKTSDQGKVALGSVTEALQGLTLFAREITTAAHSVATAFDGKSQIKTTE
jgi:hypothetical protein